MSISFKAFKYTFLIALWLYLISYGSEVLESYMKAQYGDITGYVLSSVIVFLGGGAITKMILK